MMRRIPTLLTLVFLAGCGAEHASTEMSVTDALVEGAYQPPDADAEVAKVRGLLTNPYDWEFVAANEDPFAPDEPKECAPEAYGPEEVTGIWVYSLETESCSWLTVRQETVLPLQPGDRLRARVFHFALTAPTEATAHIGLAWSGDVFVTMDEPIPSHGRLVTLEYTVERPHPVGEDLFFHIDNHGENSWHLIEIRLNPSDTDP